MAHWKAAKSGIEGIDPYGSPYPEYAIQLSAKHEGHEFSGYFAGLDFIGITQIAFEGENKPYRIYTSIEAAETVAIKSINSAYRKAIVDLKTGKTVSRFIFSKQSWKRS